MTKNEALQELMRQSASDKRNTLTGYYRACRALRMLGFTGDNAKQPLSFLGYVSSETGEVYDYLADKILRSKKQK